MDSPLELEPGLLIVGMEFCPVGDLSSTDWHGLHLSSGSASVVVGTWQQAGSNGAAKHSQLIHKQEGKTTPSNTSQIVPPTGGGGVETKYSNI